MTKPSQNANRTVWQPPGELTIYTAADSKAQLDAALAQGKALDIDLASVTEFDTAGLQILILAKRASQQAGLDLCIKGHTHAVVDVLDVCNLTRFFGDPVVMTSNNQ